MRLLAIAVILMFCFSFSVLSHTPVQQKQIKDSAEYNMYVTALNTVDPVAKAAAMEAFVKQYPNSILKIDALEQAMAAYQQSNNLAKVEETANRILGFEPENIRALAIATYLKRVQATSGSAQAAKEMVVNAERGIKALPNWTKPEGTSDAEFKQVRDQMSAIFYGAAGFGALQSKDYARAREYYLKSVQIDPGNLQDVYQLSIADLEMKPIDVDGLWYIARAINLAKDNPTAQQSMTAYGKAKYKRYHGGDDGWDKVLASATTTAPPSDFSHTIKAAPTPAEIAVAAVRENNPAELSFSDWEYVLSYRDDSPENKQAADRVWQTMQDKQKNGAAKLSIDVKVISATTDTVEAAVTDENQQANKADLHVVLEKPIAAAPAAGSQIKVIGVLTSYTPRPFMFTMEKASIGK